MAGSLPAGPPTPIRRLIELGNKIIDEETALFLMSGGPCPERLYTPSEVARRGVLRSRMSQQLREPAVEVFRYCVRHGYPEGLAEDRMGRLLAACQELQRYASSDYGRPSNQQPITAESTNHFQDLLDEFQAAASELFLMNEAIAARQPIDAGPKPPGDECAARPAEEAGTPHERGGAGEATEGGAPNTSSTPGKKPKRSTARGEAKTKTISALNTHHKYDSVDPLNTVPIGNNELAQLAGVSNSRVCDLIKQWFGGRDRYRAACKDAGKLNASLKLLNGDVPPREFLLSGRNPFGEGRRADGEE